MIHIILLLNECGQHDPYYIIVERMWTTWSVLYYCRTYLDTHGPYYIIVERMWTTWSVLYYNRTYVDNMVRIILL